MNGTVLEASGLRRRPVEVGTEDRDPRIAALEAELATLRRVVVAERERADQADRELGYAMLECGRLRSALAKTLPHMDGGADGHPGAFAGAGVSSSSIGTP